MATDMTRKGLVIIPGQTRKALYLAHGSMVDFAVSGEGKDATHTLDRFEAARGRADIKWRTAELTALLRGDE